MSARKSLLALVATAAVAASTLIPGNASAFSRGSRIAAPVRVTTSTPAPSVRGGYGWGYGRGWCYWHPYACYYR